MSMKRRLWRARVDAAESRDRLLRWLQPARPRFVTHGWPFRPGVCPCDGDFVEWLTARGVRGRSVFHLGTGAHHLVGLENQSRGLDNDVLGLTLAPREHRSYVRAMLREPALGRHYKVLFADLHSLCAAALPRFDVATLFHLGEFGDLSSPARRMDEKGVLDLLCEQLVPGGRVLFYKGSFGYERAALLIAAKAQAGDIRHDEDFRSLRVYRVPGGER